MGYFRPESLPQDPELAEARRDARLLLRVAEARLREPAAEASIDAPALQEIVTDDRQTVRTRRRAATLLTEWYLTG